MAGEKVRTLVSRMTLDGSGYQTGAQQVVDANKKIVDAAADANTATERQGQVITATTRAIDRLEARIDPLVRQEMAFQRQLDLVNRALAEGQISQDRYAVVINKVQNAHAEAMAALRGETAARQAAERALEQEAAARRQVLASVEAIEARLSPHVRLQREYQRELALVNTALQAGAISGQRHALVTAQLGAAYQASLQDLNRGADGVDRLGAAYGRTNALLTSFGVTLGAIGIVQFGRSIVNASDTLSRMQSQLRLVTDSADQLASVQEDLFNLAQETRSPYEAVVQLYARMARATDQMGLSQEQLLDITQTVSQATRISGASTQEAQAVVIQFSQALSSGKLAGDEFRSVMENNSRLARALADGLGVPVEALKELSQQGELTTRRLAAALLGQGETVDKEFDGIVRTAAEALVQLENEFLRVFGDAGSPLQQAMIDFYDQIRATLADPAFQDGLRTTLSVVADVFGLVARNIDLVVAALGGLALGKATEGILALANGALTLANQFGGLPRLISAVTNPFLLATAAGIGLGEALVQLDRAIDPTRNAQDQLNQSIQDFLQVSDPARLMTVQAADAHLEAARAKLTDAQATRALLEAEADRLTSGTTDPETSVGEGTSYRLLSIEQLEIIRRLEADIAAAEARRAELTRSTSATIVSSLSAESDAARKAREKIEDLIESLRHQLEAMDQSAVQQAVLNNLRRADIDLTGALVDRRGMLLGTYSREADEIARLTRAIYAREEAERRAAIWREAALEEAAEVERRVEETARRIEQVVSSIADDLTEVIFSGFRGGFEDVTENVKLWMERIVLEIAKQKVIIPITAQIVGAAPDLFGIAAPTGSATSTASTSFDAAWTWLGEALSFSGPKPPVYATPGAGGRIPGGGVTAGFTPPAAAGPSFFQIAGDFLGAGATGFGVGSMLGGFGIGNPMGSSIGGGIGGIAGMALTPWLGPFGPVVGGLVGGLLGGLFGPGPSVGPNSNSEIRQRPGRPGELYLQYSGQDNGAGSASDFAKSIMGLVRGSLGGLGAELGAGRVLVDVGNFADQGGIFVNPTGNQGSMPGNPAARWFGEDTEAASIFAAQQIIRQAGLEEVSGAMKRAIDAAFGAETAEDLQRNLDVVSMAFADLSERAKGPVATALDELRQRYEEAADIAEELGISEERLTRQRERAEAGIRRGFVRGLQDQILGIEDPRALALRELNRWRREMLAEAEAAGGGLVEIERLYGLKRAQIIEQFARQANSALQDLLDDLTRGDLAGLSPMEQFRRQQAAFRRLAGETDTDEERSQLAGLGRELAGLAREIFASGEGYYRVIAEIEAAVRAAMGDVPGLAAGTLAAPGGLTMVGERGRELVRMPRGAEVIPHPATEALLAGWRAEQDGRRQSARSDSAPVVAAVREMQGEIVALRETVAGLLHSQVSETRKSTLETRQVREEVQSLNGNLRPLASVAARQNGGGPVRAAS